MHPMNLGMKYILPNCYY